MKDAILILAAALSGFAVGAISVFMLMPTIQTEQSAPEPFQLRTIQVQQGKALITLCIDKRTETAVPCTAFYTLP